MSDRQLFSIYLFIGALRHDHPPFHDRVVVKRLEAEEKPNQASSCQAQPLKTRHGRSDRRGRRQNRQNGERRPLDVKVGDKVIFGKYSGQTVKSRRRRAVGDARRRYFRYCRIKIPLYSEQQVV